MEIFEISRYFFPYDEVEGIELAIRKEHTSVAS